MLDSPIEYLKGVGPQRADLLKKELKIFFCKDLLLHFPFRYVDRTKIFSIKEITPDSQYIQLKGTIADWFYEGEGNAKRLVAVLDDDSGSMRLLWFKGFKWIEKSLKLNTEYLVFGKPNAFKNKFSIIHPDLEVYEKGAEKIVGTLQGIYSTTEKLKARGLDGKGFYHLLQNLFSQLNANDFPENLPATIISKYHFLSRFDSFRNIHFPVDERNLERARNRLKFEELFFIQLKLLQQKASRHQYANVFTFQKLEPHFNDFYQNHLPFQLTEAQKRVIKEMRADVTSGKQMNRLLQGDVGSGKTIVALLMMLMAIDNGCQACLMAPTEILAQQHLQTIQLLVQGLGLKIGLLTSSVKGKERKNLLEGILSGEINILIGTHALIEDEVKFHELALVVIDEQHRFGVEQRAQLWKKNKTVPHILVMTATPIPRTLAMTLYGDLDFSVIDELPPGRQPVKTVHRSEGSRLRVFGFLKEQIALGRQIYIVYPLIEESEKLDFKNLMDGYESISRAFPLPDYRVSIVHGKMKSQVKEQEMQRFVRGETNIMVSTTVIEVGVNVPNASVMVIENAERFGLSQLHQLRGRVGRGAEQSFCILLTGEKLTQVAKQRINILCRTNDGFEIAEMDLQLRGPGDIEGTQQSGIPALQIADLTKDHSVLLAARNEAEIIFTKDPELQLPENASLKKHFTLYQLKNKSWRLIS
jgi:ATP-dependent DNA helicase RecG